MLKEPFLGRTMILGRTKLGVRLNAFKTRSLDGQWIRIVSIAGYTVFKPRATYVSCASVHMETFHSDVGGPAHVGKPVGTSAEQNSSVTTTRGFNIAARHNLARGYRP